MFDCVKVVEARDIVKYLLTMSKSWAASDRFGIATAPGGLALVQDFLNTKAIEDHPDLLAALKMAQSWMIHAVRAWSTTRGGDEQPPSLNPADITRLRAL